MTKKKHFENCGRTEGRKDGRTTDATPWHKLIGSFGPDELKTGLVLLGGGYGSPGDRPGKVRLFILFLISSKKNLC